MPYVLCNMTCSVFQLLLQACEHGLSWMNPCPIPTSLELTWMYICTAPSCCIISITRLELGMDEMLVMLRRTNDDHVSFPGAAALDMST